METRRFARGAVALGVLATLALAAVACGDDDLARDDNDNGSVFQPAQATAGTGGQKGVGAPASGESADQGGGGAPASNILDRKIIFNASMALGVGDVSAAFSDVSRLASANGGFVERSAFANSEDPGKRSATLTLRVPAEKYRDTLAGLRAIPAADVKSESSQSSEVTEEYTDLQSRQRNLERTEQQYLALLEQAKTIQDILTVQDRLDSVRLSIEQIKGRLQALDDLTDLATIDVTLTTVVPAKADSEDGPKGVREAFVDAWAWFSEASRYLAAGLAVVAVAAVFLSVPAGLVFAAAIVIRRVRPLSP